MRPTLFTLSGAATELGRDVRMLGMALKATPPDGQVRGRDGWFLSTIIYAIERRSRATGSRSGNSICDECERLGHELEDGLQKLRDEPDLAKRRAIVKEIGWLVGALDRSMDDAAVGCRPHEAGILKVVRDAVIGNAIGEILELAQWDLDVSASRKANS